MWTKNTETPRQRANIKTRQRLQIRLDKIAFECFRPPFSHSVPDVLSTPLVLSSPHSGRNYPASFLAQTRLCTHQLRQSEDCYIDQILAPLTASGIPIIAANFPRIYLDLNRAPDEWPPEALADRPGDGTADIWPISPRARAGLGLVPVRVGADSDIYPHDITADLVQGRLDALYTPYHNALADLLHKARRTCGHALLLDCHSMPSHDISGNRRADIVLGDCYGETCHPDTIDYIENVFISLGYGVVRNLPYAGGYITSHYGQRHNKIEAVQIEINKDLYLNPDTLEPHAGMAPLTANMKTAILHIKNYLDMPNNLAAE